MQFTYYIQFDGTSVGFSHVFRVTIHSDLLADPWELLTSCELLVAVDKRRSVPRNEQVLFLSPSGGTDH